MVESTTPPVEGISFSKCQILFFCFFSSSYLFRNRRRFLLGKKKKRRNGNKSSMSLDWIIYLTMKVALE
jgi:hypothetical protein